jgi:hypothetical protein
MSVTSSLSHRIYGVEQNSIGFTPKIMVYEDAPVDPLRWEYHVLTIDTNKKALPDAERLNELGREGWLLNGVLNQGPTGDVSLVYYYFVRQITKERS